MMRNYLIAGLTIASVVTVAEDLKWRKQKLYFDANEACAVEDFNNDGWLDVSAGRNLFLAPDFTPQPLRDVAEFGVDYLVNNGEHAYDVDGDGWLDIIAGGFMDREVCWYRNPGEAGLSIGKQWKKRLLNETALQNEITFLRDVLGDFQPEFVVNSWNVNNPMLFWELKTGSADSTMSRYVVGASNGHGIGFGDINGDGHDDLLFQSGWYERPVDVRAGEWKLHADWQYKQASCPMIVVDLNDDGRNDVIWGSGHNYGLFWMEQLPASDGKTQWREHVIDQSWSQAHALAWVDLDGDGREDLITGKRVRAHSGNDPGADETPGLYYYTWDRTQLKFERHTIDSGDAGTGLFIRVADLDRNSWPDIVVAGKSGTFIFFSQGK